MIFDNGDGDEIGDGDGDGDGNGNGGEHKQCFEIHDDVEGLDTT